MSGPLPWVPHDGGRADAGYRGSAGDCVVRSIAIVTGRDYRAVYEACAEINAASRQRSRASGKRSARNGVLVKHPAFRRLMESFGLVWTPTMRIGSGCRVHLAAGEIPMRGKLVAVLSKHYTAVVDGVVHDTHDPGRDGTRCVYGLWSVAKEQDR